jgi:undecaprenyl-diphosphatase
VLSAPRLATLLIVAIGLLLVVALAVLIERGATLGLDLALIGALRDPALLAPLAFLQPLTELGSTGVVALVAALLLVVELVAGRTRIGLASAATIGLAALINGGAKLVVDRVRPDLLPPIVVEPGYSFPSGHSALSMVAYGIVAVLFARQRGLPRWLRVVGVALAAALVVSIGISRIYLGAHFPSDVLGGWLLGAVIVLLFASATRAVPDETAKLSPVSTSPGGGAAAADRAGPRSDPPADG